MGETTGRPAGVAAAFTKRALTTTAAFAATLAIAPAAASACTAPLACGAGLATMQDLEAKAAEHLHAGYMTEIDFGSAAQTPGDIAARGGYYDSGLWTGVYLGSQAFRYATAKSKLSQLLLPQAERTFWTAQRNQALDRVRAMVQMYERNVNIAAVWNEDLKLPPEIDLSNPARPIDLGSSVIFKGEPGMLMRSCTRVDDPLGIKDGGPDDRVVGPLRWKDGHDYWCNGSPSRDTYAGTIFGLITAFDLVGPDDAALRKLIARNVLTMADFLLKWAWTYPRPWGHIAVEHDFDNFISPLFVYEPLARLNMTVAARHVAQRAGTLVDQLKWNLVGLQEFLVPGLLTSLTKEIDSAAPHDDYYKWNLDSLNLFNLLRLTSGAERQLAAQVMAVEHRTIGDDVNAWFEALRAASTGEAARREMAKTHLLQWPAYRAATISGAPVRNSDRCGTTLTCVPEDRVDVSLDGGATRQTFRQGSSGTRRSLFPIPVAQRPPSDFLWQRSPTRLDGGQSARHRPPGIDYLAPYWLLRWSEEVDRPANRPLPAVLGPIYF